MKEAALAIAIAVSGCSAGSAASPSCAARPVDFQSWSPPQASRPAMTVTVRNTIHLDRLGGLSWNGARLGGSIDTSGYEVLDQYLAQVAELSPMPRTTVTFEAGAPCAALERVRRLMRRHLQCSRTLSCFQGEAPGRVY